jgi:hypothetical protein
MYAQLELIEPLIQESLHRSGVTRSGIPPKRGEGACGPVGCNVRKGCLTATRQESTSIDMYTVASVRDMRPGPYLL